MGFQATTISLWRLWRSLRGQEGESYQGTSNHFMQSGVMPQAAKIYPFRVVPQSLVPRTSALLLPLLTFVSHLDNTRNTSRARNNRDYNLSTTTLSCYKHTGSLIAIKLTSIIITLRLLPPGQPLLTSLVSPFQSIKLAASASTR